MEVNWTIDGGMGVRMGSKWGAYGGVWSNAGTQTFARASGRQARTTLNIEASSPCCGMWAQTVDGTLKHEKLVHFPR